MSTTAQPSTDPPNPTDTITVTSPTNRSTTRKHLIPPADVYTAECGCTAIPERGRVDQAWERYNHARHQQRRDVQAQPTTIAVPIGTIQDNRPPPGIDGAPSYPVPTGKFEVLIPGKLARWRHSAGGCARERTRRDWVNVRPAPQGWTRGVCCMWPSGAASSAAESAVEAPAPAQGGEVAKSDEVWAAPCGCTAVPERGRWDKALVHQSLARPMTSQQAVPITDEPPETPVFCAGDPPLYPPEWGRVMGLFEVITPKLARWRHTEGGQHCKFAEGTRSPKGEWAYVRPPPVGWSRGVCSMWTAGSVSAGAAGDGADPAGSA